MDNEKEIQEFLEFYKDKQLPNPEHEPIKFKAWVRNFKYYKSMSERGVK